MVSALKRVFLVSAALFATVASAQLQSYTVTVAPGYNAIANHLVTGRNTLDEVLPNVPDGTQLYKFDPISQRYAGPAEYIPGIGWYAPEPLVETLGPGEGAFLRVDTAFTLRFQGSPREPRVRTDVAGGYNFVSCQTTQRCSFEELFGFRPGLGDIVYKFDRPISGLDPRDEASSIHQYSSNGWDSAPFFDLGRSAFVYLGGAPRIIEQPTNQTVLAGTTLQLSVSAVGEPSLNYQWRFEGRPLPGQTGSTLRLQSAALSNTGPYRVVISNAVGVVTSELARVRVVSPPRILEPPLSQTRIAGETAIFKVLAEGTAPLAYQWLRENVPIPDGTNAMLMIPNVSPNHAGKYSVRISNALGQALSPTATLDVLVPPFIVTQPKSQTVNVNDRVTFFVQAGGTQPLSYQWLRNGVRLVGETNESLTIQSVQPQDGGSYRVVVFNAAGATQSDPALLRVNIPFGLLTDIFGDRELFREPANLMQSSNRGATREPWEPPHAGKPGGKSVWMAWVSDKAGIVTFRTRGSQFDTLLAAYVQDQPGLLREVASDDDSDGFHNSQISFNVEPGQPYEIVVDGYNGYEGDIVLEWFFESTNEKLPVIVEQPADQVAKLGGNATFVVRTEMPNAIFHWFFNGQQLPNGSGPVLMLNNLQEEQAGLYYVRVTDGRRVVTSRMVTLQFSSVGPDDTVLPLFARDKFGDVVDRPEQPQPGGFGAALTSKADANGVASLPAMAAGGGVVHGYTGTQLFSTVGAVKDEGEPDHCGIPGGASYWFSYVPPASANLFLNTHGSSYDTVLAVYTSTGPTYDDLVSVACDNNSGTNGLTSNLNFPAVAGVTYYVVIDGVNAATGNVRLNYRLLVPLTISNLSVTNSVRFRITATPFFPFTIQRSSNLVNWTTIITTNTATGILTYLDTGSATQRFYRALQIP